MAPDWVHGEGTECRQVKLLGLLNGTVQEDTDNSV